VPTPIHLIRAGPGVPVELLDDLAAFLARTLHVSCHVNLEPIDIANAHDPARGQYRSTEILKHLAAHPTHPPARQLAITAADLFVPVLTFVFGEAQLAGTCAVVSLHRLHEEFYGLPANPALLRDRLHKEALHELGHTLGLRHCDDWRCVMCSSHSVERLDLKEGFCEECAQLTTREIVSQPAMLIRRVSLI
jgi:archaemetzincin